MSHPSAAKGDPRGLTLFRRSHRKAAHPLPRPVFEYRWHPRTQLLSGATLQPEAAPGPVVLVGGRGQASPDERRAGHDDSFLDRVNEVRTGRLAGRPGGRRRRSHEATRRLAPPIRSAPRRPRARRAGSAARPTAPGSTAIVHVAGGVVEASSELTVEAPALDGTGRFLECGRTPADECPPSPSYDTPGGSRTPTRLAVS